MIKIYKNAINIYYFMLVLFLMYGPISNTLGIDLLLLAIFLSLTYIGRVVEKLLIPPLLFILGAQACIFFVSLFNMYFELDWLFKFSRIFFHFIASIIIANIIIIKNGVHRLFLYIVISSVFLSVVIIASLVINPLNDFLMAEFQSNQAVESFTGGRFSGFTRTYTISFSLSISTIFAAYLYSVRAIKENTFLSFVLIIFMGSFLNARAGWIIGGASLVLISFFSPLIRKKFAFKLSFLMVIVIVLLAMLALNIDLISDTPLYFPVSIALEFLINYLQGDGMIAASMQDYSSKFFDWNEESNLLQLIFGSGAFGRGEGLYLQTDNGYAFLFSGVGFFGLLIIFFLIVSLIIPRRISDVKNSLWLILAILVVGMFLYNFKEYVLFGRNFLSLVAFAYAAFHYQAWRYK